MKYAPVQERMRREREREKWRGCHRLPPSSLLHDMVMGDVRVTLEAVYKDQISPENFGEKMSFATDEYLFGGVGEQVR